MANLPDKATALQKLERLLTENEIADLVDMLLVIDAVSEGFG
jgi:hypothetical protein